MTHEQDVDLDPRTRSVHREACVFIGYTNPAMTFGKEAVSAAIFAERHPQMQGGLWNLRAGEAGMTALSVGVHTYCRDASPPPSGPVRAPVCSDEECVRMILRFLDAVYEVIEDHDEETAVARSVGEADRIVASGRMAIFIHLTGAWIGGDLAVLRCYHRLGVRAIHVCVEGLADIGDSSDVPPRHGGISDLGRHVVDEMNRLGMVIDVSHASDEAARQIVARSADPVVSSHTGCRSICDINRNLPDDLILAIAEKGGVIGMHFATSMLCPQAKDESGLYDHELVERLSRAERELRRRYPDPYEYLHHRMTEQFAEMVNREPAPASDRGSEIAPAAPGMDAVIRHIDHVVQLTGIDHVGIGTDYDIGGPPQGLEHAGKLANLTGALLRHGHDEQAVEKMMGGNFRRVYEQVLDQ